MGCQFGFNPGQQPDAIFGSPNQGSVASVLRSMESSHYYPENNIDLARRWVSLTNMMDSYSSENSFPLYYS